MLNHIFVDFLRQMKSQTVGAGEAEIEETIALLEEVKPESGELKTPIPDDAAPKGYEVIATILSGYPDQLITEKTPRQIQLLEKQVENLPGHTPTPKID